MAFGQDADGELYVLANNSSQLVGKTGKVFKLVPMWIGGRFEKSPP